MIKLLYNRCVGIYKFGNNTYPRRVGRRSNLGHSFQGKKCVLWAGKYGTYLLTHHSMGQKLCCLTQFPSEPILILTQHISQPPPQLMPTSEALLYYTMSYGQSQRGRE